MPVLPIAPRTGPTLLVLNAFSAPEAADVAVGLFSRFPPFGWSYSLGFLRGWQWWPFKLFAEVHRCFTHTGQYATPVRPWDDWKGELTASVNGASGRFFLCSGSAPLPLWMLLGHLLWNKEKGLMHVLVVNFRKQSGPQTFTIEMSLDTSTSSAGHLLAVSAPPQEPVPADAVALLYVSLNARYDVTTDQAQTIEAVIGAGPVMIWRLRPQSGIVNVDQANLGRIAVEIQAVLDDIASKNCTLLLATSGVDAVAFVMGALVNRHMFSRVVFLDFVQNSYVKAIEI